MRIELRAHADVVAVDADDPVGPWPDWKGSFANNPWERRLFQFPVELETRGTAMGFCIDPR
jgi:hypothetical protein